MIRTMFRYEVPIDGERHVFALSHTPVAVAAVREDGFTHVVEFWCEHTAGATQVERTFQVFGTGHPLPGNAKWAGTCPRLDGLVWHLYEIGSGHPKEIT